MAARLTNYLAFVHPELKVPRIGHLNRNNATIQPLAFASGTPLENLYQVIEAGQENIKPAGHPVSLSSVQILPPINGRDILAVGKNYAEHAVEFNKSGYDSSDKVDQPSHPVLFTKRATSIVSHGHPIALHRSFTQTLDYEGELGVIIGKAGFGISKANAMEYVWGYTIINDVTARERQRDHKQFFIGKSGDNYCPMVSGFVLCSWHMQCKRLMEMFSSFLHIGTDCCTLGGSSRYPHRPDLCQWPGEAESDHQ